MSKSAIVWGIVIVVIVVIGIGTYLATYNNTQNANNTQNSTSTSSSNSSDDKRVAATITYSNNGFSPNVTTVGSGDSVTIKNTSPSDLQMDSDPHPAHTDNIDLNVGLVRPGQSATFTVTKTGTFGFHNHLESSDTATIIIK